MWDFRVEPEFQDRLDWLEQFVRDRVWPLEASLEHADLDQAKAALKPLRDEVKAHGLWTPHLPGDVDAGPTQLHLGLIHEVVGSSPWGPYVIGANPPDSGNGEIIHAFGTPEQKSRYLDPLLAGIAFSGFSMTEPDTAGSDPTLLASSARLVGDQWVINGHKWYTTNGSVADFLIVMVVTHPDAPPRDRATLFLVEAGTPGVKIVRDVPTMEHPHLSKHGLGSHAEIRFDDVVVGQDAVLGEVGQGFQIAQHRLGPGRIHHCMRWLGLERRAFDLMCHQANTRFSHGSLLAEKQTVQNWVADSAAEMQAARLMTLHAAWKMDTYGARAAADDIAMVKYFGAKVVLDVIDRAIQAHGARGYSTDLPLESMYRAARASRIYDGPDEVHRQTLSRRLLKAAGTGTGGS